MLCFVTDETKGQLAGHTLEKYYKSSKIFQNRSEAITIPPKQLLRHISKTYRTIKIMQNVHLNHRENYGPFTVHEVELVI